ncbi:MAG: HK97-gp10 family putative phage morphogenesis protein [Desulfovibrionaceae bacterium]
MSGEYVDVQITGLKELERKLLQLPDKIADKVLRSAVLSGAGVVRKRARLLAPKRTGKLAKSIRSKVRKRTGKFVRIYDVGPTVRYGHLVEYGTAPHVIKVRKALAMGKDGRFGKVVEHPGSAPRPFLRPAFDSATTDIIETMRKKMAAGIEKEASTP